MSLNGKLTQQPSKFIGTAEYRFGGGNQFVHLIVLQRKRSRNGLKFFAKLRIGMGLQAYVDYVKIYG